MDKMASIASDSGLMGKSQEEGILDYLPQPTNLKQFVLVACASKDDSLIGFTSFIRASPNLEKFVLKLQWRGNDIVREDRESKKALSFLLQHLRVVESLGYYGRRSELELVEYFLENAVVLEKIIVDPRDQTMVGRPKKLEEIKKEKLLKFMPRNSSRNSYLHILNL